MCRPVSTDRISAEIAQLGERQTEDWKKKSLVQSRFRQYSSLWLDQYSQNLHMLGEERLNNSIWCH